MALMTGHYFLVLGAMNHGPLFDAPVIEVGICETCGTLVAGGYTEVHAAVHRASGVTVTRVTKEGT